MSKQPTAQSSPPGIVPVAFNETDEQAENSTVEQGNSASQSPLDADAIDPESASTAHQLTDATVAETKAPTVRAASARKTTLVSAQPLPIPPPDAELVAPPTPGGSPGLPPLGPIRSQPSEVNLLPIDLPTALQLANGQNFQVLFAREQINQAWAQYRAARALWLPSINGGVGYNKHDGIIQAVDGTVFRTSRADLNGGLTAQSQGAGSPASTPGIYANFRLADALYQPLAARQGAEARRFAAAAATNDILLQVSLAYLEFLRASADVAIARQARDNAQQLADLTANYALAGQGLQSDADRARTELAVRRNDVSRSQVAAQVASAKLAQLLRLDAAVLLQPAEPTMLAIELLSPSAMVGELVAQGLTGRPELAQQRALVAQAVARMQRERYAVFMPSIIFGLSYSAFGGGLGGTISSLQDRMDGDAVAYWQVRNLGFGEAAARSETRSLVRQADVNRLLAMDVVAREIVVAQAQVAAGQEQMLIGQEALAAAQDSYVHNMQRIKLAQGLPIEVLQSNIALAQAQREYLRAVTDYNIAQFTLYRAVGWPGQISPAAAPVKNEPPQ